MLCMRALLPYKPNERWPITRAQGDSAGNLKGGNAEGFSRGEQSNSNSHQTRERPKQKPRSLQVKVPGQMCFCRSRPPIDSRRSNQVGCRQVFWLPGQSPAAPSHHDNASKQWLVAAVVTGYSGASAADSHGLPFSPRLPPRQPTTENY